MIGIYKITSPSGRVYIGQSSNILRRWKSYRRLDKSTKEQVKLYKSFLKYGVENHTFEVIKECENRSDLNLLEPLYIKEYDSIKNGLNCRCGGDYSDMDCETRNKISIGKKGKPRPDLSIRNKMSPTCTGRSGFLHPTARLILNLQTGIYYFGLPEAASVLGMKDNTLQKMLSGKNKNKTDFIYV